MPETHTERFTVTNYRLVKVKVCLCSPRWKQKNLRAVPAGCGRGTIPHGGADGRAVIGVNSGGAGAPALCSLQGEWSVCLVFFLGQVSLGHAEICCWCSPPWKTTTYQRLGRVSCCCTWRRLSSLLLAWWRGWWNCVWWGVSLENAEMKSLNSTFLCVQMSEGDVGAAGASHHWSSRWDDSLPGGGWRRRTDVVTFLPQDK